jgi:NADH:ubiquinone oxidoreductase subunit 3 (subunit A)
MDGWAFIGIFVVVAAVLLTVPLIIAALIAPRKPNAIKSETYECGI